jgi:hypothetical protein
VIPKPYYEYDGVTLYHGDCREVRGSSEFRLSFEIGDPLAQSRERALRRL